MPYCGLIHEFRNKESLEKNYLNMKITDPEVDIHWLFLSRNNDEKDRRYSNENYNWSQILAKNNLTWETIEKSNGVESGAERGTTPNVPTDQIQSIETWMTLQKGNKISGKETKEFYKTIPPTLIRDRKKTSLIRTDSIILKDGQYGYGDLKSKFYLDANINVPWFEILNLKTHNGEYYADYIQYLKNIMENGNYKKSKRILLSTIHGAKGLESANTILNCDWPYLPYGTYCKGGKDRDDELRVFYVGITRTKYNLFLYQPDFSFGEYKGMRHNNFWNKIRGK
jgi:superfamily I DNA/RNA helicase